MSGINVLAVLCISKVKRHQYEVLSLQEKYMVSYEEVGLGLAQIVDSCSAMCQLCHSYIRCLHGALYYAAMSYHSKICKRTVIPQ